MKKPILSFYESQKLDFKRILKLVKDYMQKRGQALLILETV